MFAPLLFRFPLLGCALCVAGVSLWPASLHAQIIQTGNVTTVLGPTFFLDDATNGGTDTDYNTNGSYTNIRTFGSQLTRIQAPLQ
jgi:hypothetical protein